MINEKTALQLVNRKADFFYKTNRFESIRITNRIESIRIANWNALVSILELWCCCVARTGSDSEYWQLNEQTYFDYTRGLPQ